MREELSDVTVREVALLTDLANQRSLSESKAIVSSLESDCGYEWRPVGNRENNYGIINIGSNPGYALIERVTNAVDAVLEHTALSREKAGNSEVPRTPREAAEVWYGIPSGRLKNLDVERRQELADQVVIRLLDGKAVRKPVVEIRDLGIGLTPEQFPHTILGLAEGNKIDKLYLAGAFGQGGSTALAFSPEGSLFVSRRQPDVLGDSDHDVVGITFARFRDLDPLRNKNGRYEYLVRPDLTVGWVPAGELSDFRPGTSVVHFNLEIDKYASRLTQLTGSLWWLLQNALFDPVLPVWAEEHRTRHIKDGSPERRSIAGNHSRLAEDRRDKVEHGDSIEIPLEDSRGQSLIRVHYWVVRETEDGKRKRPIDAYVDPFLPVTYTYYGQSHGTDDQRFTGDRLSLPYLSKFLILQVELDGLAPFARRELLSTTRDRLKESALYEEMREQISSAISVDPELIRLNEERKESILSRHSDAERERMREKFARLMERHQAGTDAAAAGKGPEKKGRPKKTSSSREPLEPLPTADEPSFIKIANVQRPIPVHKNRSALIRLESDAPDGYLTAHTHAHITIGADPESAVKLASISDFRGGRSRLVVRPNPDVAAGTEGTVTTFLFSPTGASFNSAARFKILEPKDESTSGNKGRGQVRAPEPVAVHKDQWPDFAWDETSVAEVREEIDKVTIFVNMDNQHIRKLLDAGGYKERGHRRMSNNFLLYVAFYAWLQHRTHRKESPGLEGQEFELYTQHELDRAAQTVIHSISGEGRLED